jgi:hypothetical protein
MSMQMNAEFKKEQIGTLFVWVGAMEGGLGGRVVPQGCNSKQYMCLSKTIKHPPGSPINFWDQHPFAPAVWLS